MSDKNNDVLDEIIKQVMSDDFMDRHDAEPEPETQLPPVEEVQEPEEPQQEQELENQPQESEEPAEEPAEEPTVELVEVPADENPEEPKAKKKLSKKGIIGIVAGVFVVAIAALCVYMFSGLTIDKEVGSKTAEELSAVQIEDGVLTRGQEAESTPAPQVSEEPEVQPEESEEPVEETPEEPQNEEDSAFIDGLDTDDDDPAVGIVELPEDVQVAIGQIGYGSTTNYTTSYLKPGYDQIQTFVCYGLDEIGISDAIILVTLDPIHHKIKLTNIARDTYVVYHDKGYSSKVNHAFRWGGASYALQILNENFSLNVEDYISIDFDNMEDLIDFFGGVEVDVDYAEWKFMNNPAIEIGRTTLDGKFGLKYCRIRTIDSDLVRQSRQQEVLLSMYNKAKEISPTYYPALIRQCAKMTTTSFDITDLISMSDILLDDELTIEMHSIPGDDAINAFGGTIYGGWYYIYDLDYASDYIYQIIYEDYYVSGYDAEAVDAYEQENGLGKYAEEGTDADDGEVNRGING